MNIIGLQEIDVNRSGAKHRISAPPRAHLNFEVIDEIIILEYTHVAATPTPSRKEDGVGGAEKNRLFESRRY